MALSLFLFVRQRISLRSVLRLIIVLGVVIPTAVFFFLPPTQDKTSDPPTEHFSEMLETLELRSFDGEDKELLKRIADLDKMRYAIRKVLNSLERRRTICLQEVEKESKKIVNAMSKKTEILKRDVSETEPERQKAESDLPELNWDNRSFQWRRNGR
eukprot:m.26376 g.26376  ORF g.26376 m.26376 type:complete len:157 (+) comp29289_c0_seq1:21-491(+)